MKKINLTNKTILLAGISLVAIFGLLITYSLLENDPFYNDQTAALGEIASINMANPVHWLLAIIPMLIVGLLFIWNTKSSKGVEELQKELNQYKENIEKQAHLARQIGTGNLDIEVEEDIKQDKLGQALINMRSSLQKNKEKEEENKWIIKGKEKVVNVLSQKLDLDTMAYETIKEIAAYLGAVQGALYIMNGEEEEDFTLDMVAMYAYSRRKYVRKSFREGQGLIGQAAFEKTIIHRTEIPDDYLSITSGLLGEKKPQSILIVPLITDEKLFGVIELASIAQFHGSHIRLMEELSDVVARTLLNINIVNTEKMKGQMQALSENSPDLIARITKEEVITYMNPVIEELTGEPATKYLHSHVDEVSLPNELKIAWTNLLHQSIKDELKEEEEIDFKTEGKDMVSMHITAIPEFNDETGQYESALIVSHDITERKQIEQEISDKNKKITDSINYAQRIQYSIVPDNAVIREQLPESFIFYRAKDVVSGDFPWYYKKEDELYIAAVDCTGHGVPGAMMSLIGYFLLNDIVGNNDHLNPDEILNRLHDGVRRTLRQDQEGSKARDGMDIALCRINLQNNQIMYSGAHRPLYHVRGGELIQYKGDKKAIGGKPLKGEEDFTNYEIEVKQGDAIYFFSDGLPDQFGGPKNFKYGPKRVREFAINNHGKSMKEMHNIFSEDFDAWKEGHKQMDDVLLIGIGF